MGKHTFQALRGVSFNIEKNELVSIVGPSGSGKTTTMHLMGLLSSPSGGEYFLDDKATASFNRNQQAFYRNHKIGFIFQQFLLLTKLSALDNVSLPLMYRNVPKNERDAKAHAILEKVGMDKYAKHRPLELSGGQQQRVAIARALVGDPEIILADEPTGALDTKTTRIVMDLLKSFSEVATIVIITHDLEVAAECPRQIHILDGVVEKDVATEK
jgi:putative ABC transport system ATP-binding protein